MIIYINPNQSDAMDFVKYLIWHGHTAETDYRFNRHTKFEKEQIQFYYEMFLKSPNRFNFHIPTHKVIVRQTKVIYS